MSFLRRLGFGNGRASRPPDWVAFMEPEEYTDFRRQVGAWLISHGMDVVDVPGGVTATRDDGEATTLGLANLAQICHQLRREQWQQAIADHLALLYKVGSIAEPALEDVRSRIKVRVYPTDFLRDAPEDKQPVVRPLAPGIDAALVLDYPDMISVLDAQTLVEAGMSADEAFELGLSHVREEDVPDEVRGEDGVLRALVGDTFFVSTWLLMMGHWLPAELPNGAIVAAPNRHLLLIEPIRDSSCIQAIGGLITEASEQYSAGPGSISPALYWWRPDGSLTLLPSEAAPTPTFMPPEELVEILNALPASAT